jgi:NAD-dependent deacetylase
MLRPDVVWFGESLPQDVWTNAIMHAQSCDVMVIAGTSLVVSPANTLPLYAKQNDAVLIEVNPERTSLSEDMSLSLRETSANALPHLVTLFDRV